MTNDTKSQAPHTEHTGSSLSSPPKVSVRKRSSSQAVTGGVGDHASHRQHTLRCLSVLVSSMENVDQVGQPVVVDLRTQHRLPPMYVFEVPDKAVGRQADALRHALTHKLRSSGGISEMEQEDITSKDSRSREKIESLRCRWWCERGHGNRRAPCTATQTLWQRAASPALQN